MGDSNPKILFDTETLNIIRRVLAHAVTLSDAQQMIQSKCSRIPTKYQCWGLFDGYHSEYRGFCLSGVIAIDNPKKSDEKRKEQYTDCFAIGVQLRLEVETPREKKDG